MLNPRKIRKRAFFLKFFSFKTKLILSLVFVLILAVIFSYNYLQEVRADYLSYTEDFHDAVAKDVTNTTSKWETAVAPAGKARLWGKEWVNAANTAIGYENISSLPTSASVSDLIIKVGSNNIPYVVWIEDVGSYDIFFTKWTPGAGSGVCGGSLTDCWTNMAGTVLGPENISQTATVSSMPKLVLDSSNNPFIVWSEQIVGHEARFTKWTPSANAWTKMNGTTVPTSYEILPLYDCFRPDIDLDSNNYPYVVAETSSQLNFTRWNGTIWSAMNNFPGYEFISATTGLKPIIKISRSSIPDQNDNPYIVFRETADMYFIRWKKGDDGSVCGVGKTACWTNFAGDTIGQENISNTFAVFYQDFDMEIDKSTDPNIPYVAWPNSVAGKTEVYFSKVSLGAGPIICGFGINDCWTKMDGTTSPSYDNVSNTPGFHSLGIKLGLDSAKNPYITWTDEATGNYDICFTKWTPGPGWTKMDGTILPTSYDNLSNNATASLNPILQIDQLNNKAYVIWHDADIYISKGVPATGWTKIDGTIGPPTYDDLSGVSGNYPIFTFGPDRNLYTIWVQNVGANTDVLFTKIMPDYQAPGIVQSLNINSGTDFITNAKIAANETLNGQTINYSLSNDGGATWEAATNNVLHNFTTLGVDLRWKAELVTTLNSVTPVIDDLNINYQTNKISCSLTPNSLSSGQSVTINATTGVTAPDRVWAEIEKNSLLFATYDLDPVGGNDYQKAVPTNDTFLGVNDVSVFVSKSGSSYVCHPGNGATWQKMSANDMAWPARSQFGAVNYQNKIFVIGGLEDRISKDIWYSADNGVNWVGPTAAPWPGKGAVNGRSNFGLTEFNNQLWFYGGNYYEDYTYDVPILNLFNDSWYSNDGLTWQQVSGKENAAWAKRQLFGLAVLNNKLYLSGGFGFTNPAPFNYDDVWVTSNGVDWTCLVGDVDPGCPNTTPAWSKRGTHQMVAWDEDGSGPAPKKLWILGGRDSVPTYFKDIYSSVDGITWNLVTNSPEWGSPNPLNPAENGRSLHRVVVFDEPGDAPDLGEKMYLMGGMIITSAEIDYNDVWVTTTQAGEQGVHWTKIAPTVDFKNYDYASEPSTWTHWSARRGFETVVKDNQIYLLGGYERFRGNWNDVWHTSNGSDWTLIGQNYDAIFGSRWRPSLVSFDPAGPAPEKLWLLGGLSPQFGGLQNDVWSSEEGADWTLEVPTGVAPWAKRHGQKVINFNNKLYLIGGCDSGTGICYGRCSGGTVTYCTNGINASSGITATYCDPGFICNSANFEEVWSSTDATTWALEPAPAWVGRYEPTVTIFNSGTNNGLWMTGGQVFGRCSGGTRPGSICRRTADVPAQCPASLPLIPAGVCSKICFGGVNRGLFCATDANCPASVCGGTNANQYLNDVWFSPNGTNWYSGFCVGGTAPDAPCNDNVPCLGGGTCQVNKATWPARDMHAAAVLNSGSGDKLYIMGGWNNVSLNDVYSTPNGRTWTNLGAAPWSTRYTLEALSYNDKIYIFGGNHYVIGSVYFFPALWTNDVWAFDGNSWSAVTSAAAWQGRDFFAATLFKNRMWLAGGDSNGGTNNDVWASTYDYSGMTFSVGTPPGSLGSSCTDAAPEDPTAVVPSCQALTSASISWNFKDNATCEMGFRVFEAGTDALKKFVEQPNLSSIEETGLDVNKQYSRYVKAYNAAGESAATSVASCFTLAKVPNQPIILSTSEDKIILQIDPNDDNPTGTEYAIKELNSSEYIQADGTFSANKTWQTYENWGGVTGIEVIGVLPSQPTYPEPNPPVNAAFHVSLTSGQNYSFVVIARNGDGFETAPSSVVSSITSSVPVKAPKIVTTKGVGINLALYQTSVFGKIAQAAGIFISGNAQNQGNSILDEFSFLLNFILLVLAIILIINLFKTAQYLKQDNNCKKCLGVIWLLLTREPAKIFIDHAAKDPEGNYIISYDKHRSSHLFGRKTLLGALSILALKLVILLSLIFGLIKVNHFGIAQTAPYDQTGTPVNVGDTLNYIIEINNQGTGPANDAVIMDTLDSSLGNFAVTGITDCGTYTDKSTAAVLNVDGFDLAPGSTCVITFTVKVKTESEGNTITNQALILGSNFSTVYTNSTSNTVRAVPVPLCGNAKIDSGEQCDPAGCKSDERCVNCQCHPIPPASVCGNGKLEAGEQCDPAGCGADQNCVNCRCQEVVIPPLPPIIPPVIPPVIPPITPPGIPGVQPSQIPIISPIINAIKTIIPESVNAILDNPQVEQTSQNIVTPILLTVAVLTTVPLIASISIYLLPYLHLIFLEPFLLLFRKKRKKWGVVYNALTKIPVDLVLVRVYRQDNNQLIQTKVTDREGRYILIINEPGKYYLTVTKPGFVYPTKYLLQDKQDAKYLDLYHGEPIQVTEKDAVITANIPLDPAEKKVLPIGEVVRSYLLKNIRLIISYIGMILALLIVIIYPTAITIGALILHVILFLSFRRVVVPAKPKSWGIVYDDQNKMPLHQAIVRIFDTRFNKLLETQITDRKGRYAFLVGKNEYQLLTEKEGYQPKEVKPVDLVKNEEVVNLDVGMQKS